MKSIKATTLAFHVALVFVLAACDSNDAQPPAESCRIVTLTETSGNSTRVHNMTYNADGMLSTVASGSGNTVFSYTADGFLRQHYDGDGQLSRSGQVTLNGRGQPLKEIDQIYGSNQSVLSTEITTYTYDAQGYLQKLVSQEDNNSPETTIATWSNGNVIQLAAGTYSQSLTYYTDREYQIGDYLYTFNLLNLGVNPFKSKNLLKSISTPDLLLNASYEFDAEGKISEMTFTRSDTSNPITAAYQYSCS